MEERDSFDAVAGLYAQARPGYPAALFDDLTALAGLGPTTRVLEVGCGAGQATVDLAARAASVVALDPGPSLIAQAQRRGAAAANVEFAVSRFEDFAVAPGAFDLVASAQAWHWVDPGVGFRKASAALGPAGVLAVFGHVPMDPDEPFRSAFQRAFDRHAPGVWGLPPPQTAYLPEGPYPRLFAESGLFEPTVHRRYPWTWRLTPEAFGAYLRTDSSYHFLEAAPRFALFDDLAAAVAANGGRFDAKWETHLHLARRL